MVKFVQLQTYFRTKYSVLDIFLKSNSRKKRFILANKKLGSIMPTNITRQAYEAPGHIVSADGGWEDSSPGAQLYFSFLFSLRSESTE